MFLCRPNSFNVANQIIKEAQWFPSWIVCILGLRIILFSIGLFINKMVRAEWIKIKERLKNHYSVRFIFEFGQPSRGNQVH